MEKCNMSSTESWGKQYILRGQCYEGNDPDGKEQMKMLRCENMEGIFNNSMESCLSGVTIKFKKLNVP